MFSEAPGQSLGSPISGEEVESRIGGVLVFVLVQSCCSLSSPLARSACSESTIQHSAPPSGKATTRAPAVPVTVDVICCGAFQWPHSLTGRRIPGRSPLLLPQCEA